MLNLVDIVVLAVLHLRLTRYQILCDFSKVMLSISINNIT